MSSIRLTSLRICTKLGTLLFSCAEVSKCGKTFVICRKLASVCALSFLLPFSTNFLLLAGKSEIGTRKQKKPYRNYCRHQFAQLPKSLSHSPAHIAWPSIQSKLHVNCIDKFWHRCAAYESGELT